MAEPNSHAGETPAARVGRVRGAERSSARDLELRNLSRAFGSVQAIRDVSLKAGAGEFVSFLGPSGSGKTTTLMAIAGFVAPESGSVLLGGTDITLLPPYRRNLGMVYQNYALFPHLTVERNIAFPLEMRGAPRRAIRQRVAEMLDLVQLAGVGARLPRQLSGGQQQRVALARALVFEPPVLLMDEPLGALDKKLREDLQQEIKRIQRRLGITTIYVTHDQEEALTMSDRVVVMRSGAVEQVATPIALYDRPANAFVAEFIGAANLLGVDVLERGPPARVRSKGGLVFAAGTAGDVASGAAAVAVIRPERVRVVGPEAAGTTYPARLLEATFAGGVWRLRVSLPAGEEMLIVQSNLGKTPPEAGTSVFVTWSADDVWVVPPHP